MLRQDARGCRYVPCLSHITHFLIISGKSTAPQNRQLVVYCYLLKCPGDGLVWELTFSSSLIDALCREVCHTPRVGHSLDSSGESHVGRARVVFIVIVLIEIVVAYINHQLLSEEGTPGNMVRTLLPEIQGQNLALTV